MPMSASVPRMIARGRFRCGSFTSPAANDRSPQPSYAHSTLTSARPIAPVPIGPGAAAVRCDTLAPCPPPSRNDAATRTTSAENFAAVETPTMAAPTLAPMMLAQAAKAMAVADSARAAM